MPSGGARPVAPPPPTSPLGTASPFPFETLDWQDDAEEVALREALGRLRQQQEQQRHRHAVGASPDALLGGFAPPGATGGAAVVPREAAVKLALAEAIAQSSAHDPGVLEELRSVRGLQDRRFRHALPDVPAPHARRGIVGRTSRRAEAAQREALLSQGGFALWRSPQKLCRQHGCLREHCEECNGGGGGGGNTNARRGRRRGGGTACCAEHGILRQHCAVCNSGGLSSGGGAAVGVVTPSTPEDAEARWRSIVGSLSGMLLEECGGAGGGGGGGVSPPPSPPPVPAEVAGPSVGEAVMRRAGHHAEADAYRGMLQRLVERRGEQDDFRMQCQLLGGFSREVAPYGGWVV